VSIGIVRAVKKKGDFDELGRSLADEGSLDGEISCNELS
jgi:hypothetical protein